MDTCINKNSHLIVRERWQQRQRQTHIGVPQNVYFENGNKGEGKIVLNKKQCDFMRVILDKFAQIDSKNKHI